MSSEDKDTDKYRGKMIWAHSKREALCWAPPEEQNQQATEEKKLEYWLMKWVEKFVVSCL